MANVCSRLLAALCILLVTQAANASELWRVTFDTRWLGPMDAYIEISRDDEVLRGISRSGAADILANLPGEHDVSRGLVVFEARRGDDDSYTGTFLAPWKEGALTLGFDGDALTGSVDGGALAGSLSGRRADTAEAIRDYATVLRSFDDVVASKLFNPGDLETAGYREFRDIFGRIVASATDDFDLLFGFHLAWQQDPFSHFELKRSHHSAAEMFAHFDSYRVGFEAATVELDGDTAILKVRTMMGADTIEQIEAAYDRIAEQDVNNLVIDLRGNSGGAFAVKPLVEHVIDGPVPAGFFLSQVWNRDHERPPTNDEALAAPGWHGWSIISFWNDVQEKAILRVTFQPAEPNFDGNVYVLVDNKSASATELAADALRSSGVATLVGEQTAGEMLSQSMFDVGDGYVVSLPVADYYSIQHGRIEGEGVPVDVAAASAQALDVARQLIRAE